MYLSIISTFLIILLSTSSSFAEDLDVYSNNSEEELIQIYGSNQDQQEESLIKEIRGLEDLVYKSNYKKEFEFELANKYMEYSEYLIQMNRFKDAKEYLDIVQGLGVGGGKYEQLKQLVALNKISNKKQKKIKKQSLKEMISSRGLSKKESAAFIIEKQAVYTLFKKAIQYFEDKNYSLAEGEAKQILEYDPSNKYAHEMLGDIYYSTQDLDSANFHWKQSITRENLVRVNKKLNKLKKEIPFEKQLKKTDEEHFIIMYANTEAEYSSYELKELLREAYRAIYQKFGVSVKGKTVVLMYEREVFENSVRTSHLTGALYDGKIRMPLLSSEVRQSEKEMKRLIWHELSHVFIHQMAGSNVPLWLNEGIAQVIESDVSLVKPQLFWSAYYQNRLLSMKELNKGRKLFDSSEVTALFYQQSYMFIQYLKERYGFYKIVELLKELRKTPDIEAAFLAVFNSSLNQVDKRWKVWLRDKKD